MTTTPVYNFTDSWNDISTTFNGIRLNVTDTASADASKLFLLQVGGVDKLAVDKSGAFPDSLFTVADNSDRTKKVQLQVSGVTAGNTRVLTVPDFSGTIATLAGTETLTNKTFNLANNTLTGLGYGHLEDTSDSVQDLLAALSQDEMQSAAGIGPRRVMISTNGTHVIDARDHAPALHLLLLPSAGAATLDCAALAYNIPYEFISGTGGTTITLDFGEDVYIRSVHILPGDVTVRSVELRANQRATVIRLGGNQVFIDFGAPILEEGTWEPQVAGATTAGTHTYALRQAKWLRQGDMITFNAEIRLSSTASAAGQLRIEGLPFTARGNLNDQYSCVIPYWLNFTNPISGGAIEGDTSHINIWRPGGVVMDASELQNASRIRVSGSYRI